MCVHFDNSLKVRRRHPSASLFGMFTTNHTPTRQLLSLNHSSTSGPRAETGPAPGRGAHWHPNPTPVCAQYRVWCHIQLRLVYGTVSGALTRLWFTSGATSGVASESGLHPVPRLGPVHVRYCVWRSNPVPVFVRYHVWCHIQLRFASGATSGAASGSSLCPVPRLAPHPGPVPSLEP